MKKILAFFVLIITMIGVSGCMNNSNGTVPENTIKNENAIAEKKKNEALEYLSEKYLDDKFAEQAYRQSNWAYDYDVFVFHSNKYNADFSVYMEEVDSQVKFRDDYYTLYLKDDAENFYYKMCKDIINNTFSVKVRFNDDSINDSTGKITFEEYISFPHSNIDVCFVISGDSDISAQEDIISRFIEKKYSESICFYRVDTIEEVESMNYDEVVNGNNKVEKLSRYNINDDLSVTQYN